MGLFDEVSRRAQNVSLSRVAKGVAAKFAPPYTLNTVRAAIDGFSQGGLEGALRNGVSAAGEAATDYARTQLAGFLNRYGLGGILYGLDGQGGGPSKIVGGMTLEDAKRFFQKSAKTEYARKNLWFIRCVELSPRDGVGHVDMNLFATEVSYAPLTINGDPVQIGAAVFDALKGTERVEVRVSTLDDEAGTIKRWFNAKASAVAHGDGTFGLPVDYLLKMTIIHAFVGEDAASGYNATKWERIVRPGGIEHSLSRREDALEEIQMSFVEHDTFSKVL